MSSADAKADVSTTSGVLDCVSIGGAVADESVGAGASLVGFFTFSNLLNLFELICSNNAAMSSGLATVGYLSVLLSMKIVCRQSKYR